MSGAAQIATAAGVMSLYAACFHGWLYAQHRPAREQLWMALTAGSAALVCFAAAALFSSDGPAQALTALRGQIAGAAGVTLGVLRFAMRRFEVEAPRLARSVDGFAAIVLVLDLLAPQLLVATDRPPRLFTRFGADFFQFDFTPLAMALLALAFVYLLVAQGLALRALRRGRAGAAALTAALGVWLLVAINDSAVGMGLYEFPYLLSSGGYPLLVIALSSVLMRDLVRTMNRTEALGEQLQSLAHQRADALRLVDAQLARGEQLAAIGTLAAGVAHEINNPLAYVSANLNHLQQLSQEGEQDPAEVAEVLAECRQGLARVSAIASELLRMARHGASDRQELDLAAVVAGVLPLVEREAAGRARLESSLSGPLPVRGSARLLGQVALNLVWNAIHAADGASDAPHVAVATRSLDGAAELLVIDNGRGIPAELFDRVFEPSFTTSPIGQGTGLGLALVRLIVKHHGGDIRAESGAGGTIVTVRLPALDAARAA